MAAKAEEMTSPITTDSTAVQNRLACGSIRAKGAAPRIEIQITSLRPMRSPIGPPTKVPTATAPRNRNRYSCEEATDIWKRSIR